MSPWAWRRSVRALLSTHIAAGRQGGRAQRRNGEHYITRDKGEYRNMMAKAAGGGFVMAFTTLAKFALYALGLSVFWSGLAAGMNYALSFVLIQMLHFTVATKQPAMTAPAMAAKLKDIQSDDSIQEFVDEVAHLVRSQVAAILGNVLIVFPAAMALTMGYAELVKHPRLAPPMPPRCWSR